MSHRLQQPLNSFEYVALDFETTGLSASRDRVVEIGATRFRPGVPGLETFSHLIQPGRPMPAEVIAIHGIDDAALVGASDFASLAPAILQFLGQSVLLAHHAAFDLAFLFCELRRAGLPPRELLVLDTYHLARKVFPQATSYGLGALCEQLGIVMVGPAHRALPDAQACGDLFLACLKALELPLDTPLGQLVEQFPQIRVGLGLEQSDSQTHRALLAAIESQQDVAITYHNARKEILERRITPLLLGGYGRFAYVEAFCHLREENRQFRLDRIQQVHLPLTPAI